MYYDIKIDERIKGIEYGYEPERVRVINDHKALFNGRHAQHNLHRNGNGWICNCAKYSRSTRYLDEPFCAHIIAFEKMQRDDPNRFTMINAQPTNAN